MKLDIDDSRIEESFDSIAKDLLNEHIIRVNSHNFEITEIEFYYFKIGVHEDIYTHQHLRDSGEWRIHRQGLDITLKGNAEQDGGILIRGLKYARIDENGSADFTYVNGPIKALAALFESMGSIMKLSSLGLQSKNIGPRKIVKTFRHLPNKTESDFRLKKYRYLTDLENLAISEPIMSQILNDCIVL
jgi:hypothetical protein